MNAVEIKQSEGQKRSHKILSLLSPLSLSLHLLSLIISLYHSLSLSPNKPNLGIKLLEGIKTKRNKGYEFCACDFNHFCQEWSDWVPPKRRWSLRIRIVILHPPCTPAFSWLPRPCENRDLSLLFGLFKHQSSPSSKL